MSKPFFSTVLGAIAIALLGACASAESMWRDAEAASAATRVEFSYQAVTPETVTIAPGGNVTWENTALDVVGFVIFPGSISQHLACTDYRPYLTKLTDGRFRSPPLANGVSERAQLPCALAPGSYDYEIWLMGEGFGISGGDVITPQQVLRAKLVVRAPAQ